MSTAFVAQSGGSSLPIICHSHQLRIQWTYATVEVHLFFSARKAPDLRRSFLDPKPSLICFYSTLDPTNNPVNHVLGIQGTIQCCRTQSALQMY